MTIRSALADVRSGFHHHEFWRTFAADEISSRYRRSRLGQFWITLSVALFILVIGGLYRGLFANDSEDYFAYLAVGYVIWLLMADSVNKGSGVFMASKAFMLQNAMPMSVFCYRLILTEIYIFAHHLVILPPIFIYIGLWPGIDGLVAAALGFALTIYTIFWVMLILGILSLRFRDLVPITQSLMRMAFFATPVIWLERDLGGWGNVINEINPFRYFLTIVRAPLLNQPVELQVYIVSITLALMTTLAGLLLLSRTRTKIAYWL